LLLTGVLVGCAGGMMGQTAPQVVAAASAVTLTLPVQSASPALAAATIVAILPATPFASFSEQAGTPAPPTAHVVLLPTVTPTPLPTVAPTATPPLEPTPDGVQRTAQAPILMYHYISTPPPDADAYRIDLSTPPALFAAQLDRLQAEGYTTISLYQLLAHLTQGAPLPEKPVVITFDDGYRDNYESAFPLLRERGMTATFFVVTDFIDEQRPLYLSWDMAREMLAAGMSIESHSRNHFTLEGQDDDYLVWQALGSLETLQYELGVRPRFISYPAGDYDQRTIDIFHSANYWGGVTTTQGTQQSSESPFELERIRLRNTTTPDDLIRYLEADW
jgi:peptidoglycan/xylan/chitin deacetylase (PgdA/CDA1 family)